VDWSLEGGPGRLSQWMELSGASCGLGRDGLRYLFTQVGLAAAGDAIAAAQ